MTRPRFPEHSWKKSSRQTDANENRLATRRGSVCEPSPTVEPAERSDFSAAEMIFLSDEAASPELSPRWRPATRPRGIFVPENYEPNYAYPLIVWLHNAGRNEHELAEIVPHISTRNYIGLALRGTVQQSENDDGRHGWSRSLQIRDAFEQELHSAVCNLRQEYHIHSERIFLMGAGDGGTAAWDLFLNRPEWFGGAAVLNGAFPWRDRPLRQFHQLRGKSVFLATKTKKRRTVREMERAGRLLYTAGLEVAVRRYRSASGQSPAILRNIDRWIMETIGGCL
jgi:phospholipase/carboxylesterase